MMPPFDAHVAEQDRSTVSFGLFPSIMGVHMVRSHHNIHRDCLLLSLMQLFFRLVTPCVLCMIDTTSLLAI